jgi:hypothetical protein
MPVETTRLRLVVKDTHQDTARVKELVIWPGEAGAVPPLPKGGANGGLVCQIPQTEITPIFLNQSGFNSGKPKCFTAPTLADGTPFEVRAAGGAEVVFKGVEYGWFSRYPGGIGRLRDARFVIYGAPKNQPFLAFALLRHPPFVIKSAPNWGG